MPLKILLVDDEPLAREGLRMLLSRDPDITSIVEAKNGQEAVNAIRNARPDLVFLDVQMPEMDGFSVVKEIGAEQMPSVVFVTAHDRYAIQAFEINAIDYLLKPVTEERFTQTLNRAKGRLRSKPVDEASRQILSLLETITSPHRYLKRLAVRTAGKTVFVDVEDIDWIEAAGVYVDLHVRGKELLYRSALNELSTSLDPTHFIRIHRSVIVNIDSISELQPISHGEFELVLNDGHRARVSRTYRTELERRLGQSL